MAVLLVHALVLDTMALDFVQADPPTTQPGGTGGEAAPAAVPGEETGLLGVSGTSHGEVLDSGPADARVILAEPDYGQPSSETLADRVARERAALPQPEVVGFDPELSVEDVSARTVEGTVYSNVDGSTTQVLSSQPEHYQVGDRWEDIDPHLVASKNRPGVFVADKNSFQVEASVAGVQITLPSGKRIAYVPGGTEGRLATPVLSKDAMSVTYMDVWPGVDVRFVMSNWGVSKQVILKSLGTAASFDIELDGVVVKSDDDGGLVVEGELAKELSFGGVLAEDQDGAVFEDAGAVLAAQESGRGSVVTLGVDPEWLAKLPVDQFPVVIDPTVAIGSLPGAQYSWARDSSNIEFGCSGGSNPNCPSTRIGNASSSGLYRWRSVYGYDYQSLLPSAAWASQLYSASMNIYYGGGTSGVANVYVRPASAYNWCGVFIDWVNCANPNMEYVVGQLGTGSISLDVTSMFTNHGWWASGVPNVGWAFNGDETSGVLNWKQVLTSLSLTYNRVPIISNSGPTPMNGYTFHDHLAGVQLAVPQQIDPDSGDTLYYRFILEDPATGYVWHDSWWDSDLDSTPWDYVMYVGVGLPASWINHPLQWYVMLSNDPGGGGLVTTTTWRRSWQLVNSCPAQPQLIGPAPSFEWAPNSPPTFEISRYGDPDGDWTNYRFVFREVGSSGIVFTSPWTADSTASGSLAYTPPASAPLQAGVTYEWSAESRDAITYFFWYFYTGGPCNAASTWRSASFEDRLGVSGPSPMQSAGPVKINLATGNVFTSLSTPQVSTQGGSMGASMAYNSRANDMGLRGRFYNDSNNNGVGDASEGVSQRLDRTMQLKWASPSAVPGVSNLVATWTGYITVPTAGTYHVAAAVGGDERVQIIVGSSYTVQVNYGATTAAIPMDNPSRQTVADFSSMANVSVPVGGFMTSGSFAVLPISITYRNPSGDGYLAVYVAQGSGTYGQLPTTWLSPEARILPRGWSFNGLESSGATYTFARVEATEVVLTRTDGSTTSFAKSPSADGWIPEPGVQDVLAFDAAGIVNVTTADGYVHKFDGDGQLRTVVAPIDATSPGEPTATWTSTTLPGWTAPISRMTALSDPASGYQVTFKYEGVGAGSCPTPLPGGVPPAPGMLCQITYPDLSTMNLYYEDDGVGGKWLARVQSPGDPSNPPKLDFRPVLVAVPDPRGTGTYTVPLIGEVRDPLVNDAINAGIISDMSDYRTIITYDSVGRATNVALPKADPGATSRQSLGVEYVTSGGVTYNESRTHVAGLDNTGSSTDWDRRVLFDGTARVTDDYQAINSTSTQFMLTQTRWDQVEDRVNAIFANNQITSYVYSPEGWLTDAYGPANASCFTVTTTVTVNGSCTNPAVPHTSSLYDGGLSGLAASVWPNANFSGTPSNIVTGIGPSSATLTNYWGAAGPAQAIDAAGTSLNDNFSMRLTGSIVFPTTGTYTLTVGADDYAAVYIDDSLVTNAWWGWASGSISISGSTTKRVHIDYIEGTSTATLALQWAGPGISGTQDVPLSSLKPRYGLLTSTTIEDSGGLAPSSTRTFGYTAPGLDASYSMRTTTTTAGLTTTTSYESTGYRRRISEMLPGGNTSSYEYYGIGAGADVDVPCTPENDTTVNQGQRLRKTTSPIAADGKALIYRSVFDKLGRGVASQRGYRVGTTDNWDAGWSCTNFDPRGRVTTVTIPTGGGYPARTTTTTYPADPRLISMADSSGVIEASTDLLGRPVTSKDVWLTVSTNTYDPTTGRLSGSSGTETAGYTYDRAGRLTQQTLNGLLIAVIIYNAPGSPNEHQVATVSYPSGSGNGGNGTLGTYTYNTNGQQTGIAWTGPGGPVISSHTVVRTQSGRIIDEGIDGIDPYPAGGNFAYDAAGHLIAARGATGDYYQYEFSPTNTCGANTSAGKNANRTAARVNGVETARYCYDNADRLTSTNASGYSGTIAYDNYGNATTIAGQQYAYDGSNRHMATYSPTMASPTTTVTYQRDVTDRIISRTVTGAAASIAHRATAAASSGSASTTSLTVNKPSGTAAGDVMIAAITRSGGPSLTDSAPAGWNLVDIAYQGTNVITTMVYSKVAGASEPSSYAFTLSASRRMAGSISSYSGVDQVNPIDTSAEYTSTTASATLPAPSVTTSASNERIVAVWGVLATATFTPDPGLTKLSDVSSAGTNAVSLSVGDRTLATPGPTGTSTSTASTSGMRALITVALRPGGSTTEQYRYVYSSTGNAFANSAGTILERVVSLPGGVLLTKRSSGDVWSYPNIDGDVVAIANASGAKQGSTLKYGPFGEAASSIPDNSAGTADFGWLGGHQRMLEHAAGLSPLVEMGDRVYSPVLGRFLSVDPVAGGSCNSYEYTCGDPINFSDLDGRERDPNTEKCEREMSDCVYTAHSLFLTEKWTCIRRFPKGARRDACIGQADNRQDKAILACKDQFRKCLHDIPELYVKVFYVNKKNGNYWVEYRYEGSAGGWWPWSSYVSPTYVLSKGICAYYKVS